GEVVEPLDLLALGRPVAFGEKRRSTDEAEVPAKPEEHEGDGEMAEADAEEARRRGAAEKNEARGADPLGAETQDDPAGEEARRIHTHDMHLDVLRRSCPGE